MASFLDKKEQRDLKILNLLYSDDRWWTGDELAKAANCSIETALKSVETLTYLADDLDNVYSITSQKNRGSCLTLTPNCSYARIESLYYRQTITYQLLDLIFQRRDLTMDELSEELFLSRSTLYRKLKNIEEILNNNNLRLDKNTLTVQGDELYLREFYYIFYWSIVHTEDWPFANVRQEIITYRINTFTQEGLLTISAIEKAQIAFRLAINFIRYQHKHFITTLPSEVVIDAEREVLLTEISAFFTANVPPTHQMREIKYLSLIIVTYPYLGEYNNEVSLKNIVNWHREQETLTYQVTDLLIKKLCKIYPNPALKEQLQQPKVLFLLYSAANYALLFPKMGAHDKIASNWYKQMANFEKEHPSFYHNLEKTILEIYQTEAYHDYLMTPYYSFYTIYNIFNYSLDITSFEEAISIKLISAGNPINELALSERLQQQMKYHLLISTSQGRDDSKEVFDLLISDVPLEGKDRPKARMDYIWDAPPSNRDWQNLNQIISDLVLNKKEERLS